MSRDALITTKRSPLKKYSTGKNTGKKLFEESKKHFFVKFTNGTLEEPQKTFTPPQKSFLRFLQRTFGELYEKKVFYSPPKVFTSIFTFAVFFQGGSFGGI